MTALTRIKAVTETTLGQTPVELGPDDEAFVQLEALRMWISRMLFASRTSWLGYGALFILLRPIVPLAILGTWLAIFFLAELTIIVLAKRLRQQLDQPAARAKLLNILSVLLFPLGLLWGVVPVLPGVADSLGISMVSMLFIAIVALLSVHNLCFIRKTLLVFTSGIMLPGVVMGIYAPFALVSWMVAPALLLLLVLQLYGRSAQKLLLHVIRSGVQSKRLNAELHRSNAELAATLEKVHEMARIDALTECLNRRAAMTVLAQEFMRSQRYGTGFGLILLDLDHFKSINDTHGHGVGDAVLVAAAQRLRARLRSTDSLARWGGEEFLCILMQVDRATLLRTAQDLCQSLGGSPLLTSPVSLTVTGSFGIAYVNADKPLDQAIDEADMAMYQAKRTGRNRVCKYTQAEAFST
ncbi:GGDEF domain-containing protein [Roseateles koreensis]|uniref:diguanylate cyclase n=1 Tax=Roseateles koreensis TaxID=2987526 RepID=A0ABT5KP32_9BURK|nr:GGDEF domain-containing protein [Roseateles koreensis]MDC8784682.1 GGDEF domain-containing protein [Roseateles koreensis]